MNAPYAILVHGGAGRQPDAEREAALAGCRQAALLGWEILHNGGNALDAAQAAVVALEDNPLFNAGTGATLNALGEVELDASIMDGRTLRAGAVAAVKRIKNPIVLARKIMQETSHVLLVGEGASRFAAEMGLHECTDHTLIVQRQLERWQEQHGTVGAVAVDRQGHLAAATSTGGVFNKLPGRVGDSALIGCGTYADTAGAVSCTGAGEAIIRMVLGKTAVDFLHAGLSPQEAAERSVALLHAKTAARGGLIILDRQGRIGYARNTIHMPVCYFFGPEARHQLDL